MTVDKLSLFNGALRNCGERRLASLSENREPRYLLDEIWDDGAVRYCLEQGQWAFATRTVKGEATPSIEPTFGWQYAFDKPVDSVRTVGVAVDSFFNQPLLDYREEAGCWFANLDTIYVRFVSDDAEYGNDMSMWPQTFVKFVQAYLARELAPRLKNFSDMDRINKEFIAKLADAKAKDALADPTVFPPTGSWVRSRYAFRGR